MGQTGQSDDGGKTVPANLSEYSRFAFPRGADSNCNDHAGAEGRKLMTRHCQSTMSLKPHQMRRALIGHRLCRKFVGLLRLAKLPFSFVAPQYSPLSGLTVSGLTVSGLGLTNTNSILSIERFTFSVRELEQ